MKSDLDIVRKLREEQTGFQPKFSLANAINVVADNINRPHDDYPLRVGKTIEMIQHFCEQEPRDLTEQDLKSIHGYLFDGEGLNEKHIIRGGYRDIQVKIMRGDVVAFNPPDPFNIPHLMGSIMPVSISEQSQDSFIASEDIKMIDWYILFQTIHPFQDGNGRVGGIAVAIMSYWKYRKFLMPIQ